MPRLAIFGSCVTRDVLEAGPLGFELAGYFARSSWISQVAHPVACPPEVAESLSSFARRVVCQDFEKTVLGELLLAMPDWVVFDLIDERFAVVEMLGSWVTVSSYLQQTSLGHSMVGSMDMIRPLDPRRESLFDDAVRVMTRQLHDGLPDARWVVHRAFYATEVAPNDSGRGFSENAVGNAHRMNQILARWYDALEEELGARVVEASPDLVVANPGHRWGLDHFHYVDRYYLSILDQLNELVGG